jgi:hypothetical protein
MVRAAFTSRSNTRPQDVQTCVCTLKRLGTRCLQPPLQSWLVF